MVKQVSGDLSQNLYSVWWYIMFVTSNTWTGTVPWCRPKFWCQDYKNIHQKTLLKLAVEQKKNWITFLTLNLVVALFWFLETRDTIMFVFHTHKCEWQQRGLSLDTLDQFASVVSIFLIYSFITYLFSKMAIELTIFTVSIFLMTSDNISASQSCMSQVTF